MFYTVTITESEGTWIAECDPLGIVTEAPSYEALIHRVWEIAPEMAELNHQPFNDTDTALRFQYDMAAYDYRIAV